jgi:hypothetical protein
VKVKPHERLATTPPANQGTPAGPLDRRLTQESGVHYMKAAACIALLPCLVGCAVHYYDTETKAEHLWGFGHMTMKVQAAGNARQAIVRGTDLIGFGIGKNDEGPFISAGWDGRRRIEIFGTDTELGLAWPASDFMSVRLGPAFPESLPAGGTQSDKQETMP